MSTRKPAPKASPSTADSASKTLNTAVVSRAALAPAATEPDLSSSMLAQPDPVANFLRETRGTLGADHQLDY